MTKFGAFRQGTTARGEQRRGRGGANGEARLQGRRSLQYRNHTVVVGETAEHASACKIVNAHTCQSSAKRSYRTTWIVNKNTYQIIVLSVIQDEVDLPKKRVLFQSKIPARGNSSNTEYCS